MSAFFVLIPMACVPRSRDAINLIFSYNSLSRRNSTSVYAN